MNKKVLILLTLIVVAVSMFAFMGCSKNDDIGVNILSNPNFEDLSSSGKETNWIVSDASTVSFVYNTHDDSYDPKLGNYYVKFNVAGAYQYVTQTVSLKKNAQYMVTAYIKVSSVTPTGEIGFRIGFETEDEEFKGFNRITTTDDEWTTITYYFTSSENVDAKFTIGVGSPSTSASAVAYADNIVLARVDEIPQAYLDANTIEVLKYTKKYSLSNGGSITFVVLMSLVSLCIAGLVYFLIAKSLKPKTNVVEAPKEHSNLYKKINEKIDLEKVKSALMSDFAIFVYILFGSLIIRFIVAVCTFGMTSNIAALESLGELGKSTGLLSFYSINESSTTPIGGVVTYTVLANIASWLKIKSASLGYAILMRLPQILADIIVTYMIYTFVATNKDQKNAAIYSAFYAFMPLFFFFTSFYGAIESIAIMFLVGMALAMLKKDYILPPLLYMCALLFSNYVLIIFPVVLAYQVIGVIQDKQTMWYNIASVAICVVVFYMFGFIMTFNSVKAGQGFEYFARIYDSFENNKFLSTDSFNMYAIFGAANSKTRTTLIEVLNWLFVAAMSAWPIFVYYKNRNRLDLILNMGLMFIAYALIGAGSTVVILPIGLVLLMLYIAIVPETRLFASFGALATLSFLNIAQLASQSGFIANITGATYTPFLHNSAFLIVFSILTVLAFFYLIYVSIDVTYFNQANEIAPLDGGFIKQIKNIFVKSKDVKNRK